MIRPQAWGLLLLAVCLALLNSPAAEAASSLKSAIRFQRVGHPSSKINWAENIKVLASVGEQWDSYAGREGSYYTGALIHLASQDNISGLLEAQRILQTTGYWSRYEPAREEQIQYPVSTDRHLPKAWLKNESHPRYALLLGQQVRERDIHDHRLNQAVRKDLKRMETFLSDERFYGLPPENIRLYSDADKAELLEGIEWLMQEQEGSSEKADILIYYSGHGKLLPSDESAWVEGDAAGQLEGLNISKRAFQELINSRLGNRNANVVLIYDMCHSGFMIADAMTTRLL